MSKLAKKPVNILEGVNVFFENDVVKISGPKGNLTFKIPEGVEIRSLDGRLTVSLKDKNNRELKPSLGLTRAMIANMVTGVTKGFEKKLELSGVGYRAQIIGKDLSVSVGFINPVIIIGIDGVNFAVNENTITVSGINKEKVGDMAARIRAIKPPEPYKGKGIKYFQERIRRKVGKAAKALGAK
jgi:large subunit ribosomal protein L6